MSDVVLYRQESHAIALPAPRHEISIRAALPGDYAFIDRLQKKHSDKVGFLQRPIIEANIEKGRVLIAESTDGRCERFGYVMFNDKYMKREELGIVYQLNIEPGMQRGLVGASLLKAAFERSAYGCKLYCCWCAQDLEANHFWESMGFVPIAFRTGSRGRGKSAAGGRPRIHIFWQRRIREGDTQTEYWFPSETNAGAVRENRIVLPIPPDTHWSDAKPSILPGMENMNVLPAGECDTSTRKLRERKVKAPPRKVSCGLWFAPAPGTPEAEAAKAEEPKPKKKKVAQKNDPKLVAAARELRDRYMERFNSEEGMLLLPPEACGKYDVSRQLEGVTGGTPVPPMLDGDGCEIIDAEVIESSECRLLNAA